MAKSTVATLQRITESNHLAFQTVEGFAFYVTGFSNGILELRPSASISAYHMVDVVAGCFGPRSTFKNVQQVNFVFGNKAVSVNRAEMATPEMIYRKWLKAPLTP